jgi:hypothetical protein
MAVGDPSGTPDPKIEILDLLRTHWGPSYLPFDVAAIYGNKSQMVFHTGWYDRDGDIPCVTVSAKSEGPLSSGTTGWTASHSTGGGMQRMDGSVSVNFVGGAWEHLRGAGTNGGDVNPKVAREQMYQHGSQILTDAGSSDLLTVAPGQTQEAEDTGDENENTIYRVSMRAGYQYDRVPNA